MKWTFWIQELAEKDEAGKPKLRLQYSQVVMLHFSIPTRMSSRGETPGRISALPPWRRCRQTMSSCRLSPRKGIPQEAPRSSCSKKAGCSKAANDRPSLAPFRLCVTLPSTACVDARRPAHHGRGSWPSLSRGAVATSHPFLRRYDWGCLHRNMPFRLLLISRFACCHIISPCVFRNRPRPLALKKF